MRTYFPVIAVLMLLCSARHTEGSIFLGNDLKYEFAVGDTSSIVESEVFTVSSALERPDFLSIGSLDVSDSNILIDFAIDGTTGPATFIGIILTDVNNVVPDFTSVAINGMTNMLGFDQSRVQFDANHIRIDWTELTFHPNTIISLDVTASAVPEPMTLATWGGLIGLAGAVGYGRRRRSAIEA